MNRWTDQQRSQIVELFFVNNRSIVAAQRAYRQLNNFAKAPSEHVIRRCVVLFREFGNVHDRHRSGRPNTSRTPTNIVMVREDVTRSPLKSVKRRLIELQMSETS